MDRQRLEKLIRTARGDEPADLVLAGGGVINVFSGQVEETSVAVSSGMIVGLGRGYRGKQELDLAGKYLAPAFIDGHLHVESTMLAPAGLAAAVVPRGTGAVAADPHEIANVMGLAGVRAMLDSSRDLPMTFFFNAPSCVPATHMETAGADLGPAEISEMLTWERTPGLSEMMNFPGVVMGDPGVLDKLLAARGRVMDGHAPLLSGKDLNAYILAGPDSDHECTRLDEAAEKLARGMWIMIRQGTSAHNLADLLPLVTPATERRCMLVSDDRHPDDLAHKGHMDDLLRQVVARGLDPMIALRLVTLNPARRFGLDDRGALAPGKRADLVVLEDLKNFRVQQVFHAGRLAASAGELAAPVQAEFSSQARDTMNLPGLDENLLALPVGGSRVRIIELIPGQLLTQEALEEPPQKGGMLVADPARDLARLSVIERHQASGRVGQGLLRGLGLTSGALASSVAHDSHNLVIAWTDEASALAAARKVGEMGGGLCAARGGEILAALPLPLAGLMSDKDLPTVLEGLEELRRAAAQICSHAEPFMPLSFVALPVIPQLKLTDRGLVDAAKFELVDLFV